ncbi:hypothetical protein OG753_36735 [Streptomyces sp. NBC_00029]|uniref:hypothetical protein n=1 Tax=Streptomyces sp. NBC_00029 TaxID=2903613 RepID=UPI003250587A
MLSKQARTEWWAQLPQGIRDEVDGYVLQDAMLAAIRILVDIGFVRHGVGVGTAEAIVSERYGHYGDRIARAPDSPLDLESLALRAGGTAGRTVAVEAIWDGDTSGWFVVLLAVTAEPAEESVLATITWSSAERYLGEGADRGGRYPMAVVAERVGGALADRLDVPFHFASPDDPDDEAPRWKPDRGAARE